MIRLYKYLITALTVALTTVNVAVGQEIVPQPTDTVSVTEVSVAETVAGADSVTMFSIEQMRQRLDVPFDTGINPALRLDTVTPTELSPLVINRKYSAKGVVPSIYSLPYSMTGRAHDWRRLWINTGVLTGAFVGTLFVLECLPEDATSWNRASLQNIPLFNRWRQHVLEKGPEWDHDKFIFNYVLHPYAGAVYFMAARSVGFNFWQSLLYCSIISNVGWEFGIEAFMERPSYQDLFITPIVGSAIGEGLYKLKRHLVANDYRLFGSPVIGNIVAFLIDPVNEVVGIFDHNPARREARRIKEARGEGAAFVPMIAPDYVGFSLTVRF